MRPTLDSQRLIRRRFLQVAGVAGAAAAVGATGHSEALGAEGGEHSLRGRIYKTLKIGMVQTGDTLAEKLEIAGQAGFAGVELNAPGFSVAEVQRAVEATGVPVDGTVCSSHWEVRHTDPAAEVRGRALETLKASLRQTRAVGGHTALLVIGHGKDGTAEECWKRAMDNIVAAIPLAAELGVVIAIENVWNHMLYNHEGGADQSAEPFAKFVDELNSPWVGMQFDIGNHWKYGPTGDWIRQLGRRIVKLDVKGFSRARNTFTNIGEGDIDWKDVRKSLIDINFYGWCAAEVKGGDLQRLKEVSANMDRVFGLGAA